MRQKSEVISQVKLREAGLLVTVYGLLVTASWFLVAGSWLLVTAYLPKWGSYLSLIP